MRFFHLLVPVVASAILFAGCGSDDPAPTMQGAWFISMVQGADCKIQGHTDSFGAVNSTDVTKRIANGANGDSIDCTVSGKGTFSVDARTSGEGLSIQLSIAKISKSATKDKPVDGTISYASPKTATTYAGHCNFFFADGTKEGVDAGKLWVSYTCDALSASGIGSSCEVVEGYAVFENCATVDDSGQ